MLNFIFWKLNMYELLGTQFTRKTLNSIFKSAPNFILKILGVFQFLWMSHQFLNWAKAILYRCQLNFLPLEKLALHGWPVCLLSSVSVGALSSAPPCSRPCRPPSCPRGPPVPTHTVSLVLIFNKKPDSWVKGGLWTFRQWTTLTTRCSIKGHWVGFKICQSLMKGQMRGAQIPQSKNKSTGFLLDTLRKKSGNAD